MAGVQTTRVRSSSSDPISPVTLGRGVNQAHTPDGRSIIVVSQSGRGWIWPATLGAWEQRACKVAGRNLTTEEWRRYVTGKPYSTICPGV